ncbi:MAG: hypothetical protein R3C49_03660 [Planctomycetaceae bacterium]
MKGHRKVQSPKTWLAVSVLLVLSTNFCWMERSSRLVAPLQTSILAIRPPWQVPITRWPWTESIATWPFALFATAVAGLAVFVTQETRSKGHELWKALLLAGISLAMQPDQWLLTVSIVLLCRSLAVGNTDSMPFRSASLTLMALILAAMTTLDFGLAWAVALGLFISGRPSAGSADFVHSLKTKGTVCGILLVSLVFLSTTTPGFFPALIRPISWIRQNHALMPSMSVFTGSLPVRSGHILLAFVIVIQVWQVLRSPSTAWTVKGMCLLFAGIGLGCGRYTVVTAVVVFELGKLRFPVVSESTSGSAGPRKFALASLTMTGAYWGWLLTVNGMSIPENPSQPRRVDPTLWRFDGPVMLTNLDHAIDWQGAAARKRFPVLLDDRWDTAADHVPEYTRATFDLLEGLREFHQKPVGEGGYRIFLDQHQPLIIAIDSTQLEPIRRLSVDPEWRVIAIDAGKTVFGKTTHLLTRGQAVRAGELFFQLEWPRPGVSMQLDGILALGTAADSRAVSRVLTAMRLPYAALRVLPDDQSIETEAARCWAYVELAHRAIRHTGEPSLLDQCRAVSGMNRLRRTSVTTAGEQDQVRRALQSLTDNTVRSTDLKKLGAGLMGLTPEQEVRTALTNGDFANAERATNDIADVGVRGFYKVLIQSPDLTSTDLLDRFRSVLKSATLPSNLEEEAAFYSGCLQLEVGDSQGAYESLTSSDLINPHSRLAAIRDLYRSQLNAMQ